MGSFSGILVVGPPHDPLGKTHFLARKNPKVWGDCLANQLASPSPQASLFCAAYSFRGYASKRGYALTEKAWEPAVRGLSKAGAYTSRRKQPILLDRGHHWFPPKYQWCMASGNVGCLFFFRVVLQHLEIWLPTRKLSPKNEPFPHLTELRFTVNQVFFLSV